MSETARDLFLSESNFVKLIKFMRGDWSSMEVPMRNLISVRVENSILIGPENFHCVALFSTPRDKSR